MNQERFDKIIATQIGISRSNARKAIWQGKATLNGQIIKDPSLLVCPENADIQFKGQAVNYKKYIYLILNKPEGIISASNDKSRETVIDLVPPQLRRTGLFPVGRLDRDTTGLLLITNDGDFGHKIISPKNNIEKTYIAYLDGEITPKLIADFENGITLADGTACKPAKLVALQNNIGEVTICEGKYHQIKRMFGVANLGVNRLHRSKIGALCLPEDLNKGECRELLETEISSIFKKC